jgi:hypothetical protein
MVNEQQIVLGGNEAVGMEIRIQCNTRLNFHPTINLRNALIATANSA